MYLHVYIILIFITKDLTKTAKRDRETFSKGAPKLTGFKTSKGLAFPIKCSVMRRYLPMQFIIIYYI